MQQHVRIGMAYQSKVMRHLYATQYEWLIRSKSMSIKPCTDSNHSDLTNSPMGPPCLLFHRSVHIP